MTTAIRERHVISTRRKNKRGEFMAIHIFRPVRGFKRTLTGTDPTTPAYVRSLIAAQADYAKWLAMGSPKATSQRNDKGSLICNGMAITRPPAGTAPVRPSAVGAGIVLFGRARVAGTVSTKAIAIGATARPSNSRNSFRARGRSASLAIQSKSSRTAPSNAPFACASKMSAVLSVSARDSPPPPMPEAATVAATAGDLPHRLQAVSASRRSQAGTT